MVKIGESDESILNKLLYGQGHTDSAVESLKNNFECARVHSESIEQRVTVLETQYAKLITKVVTVAACISSFLMFVFQGVSFVSTILKALASVKGGM